MKTTTKAKDEVKSLRAKLVEIRASLGKVEKTKRNPHFGYSYVGLEQLNALLEPKLSEHNIWLDSSVTSESVNYGEGKAGVFASVHTAHTFRDCDSDEVITVESSGLGWDAGDKATPKAITAAVKSFLKANFMISDEADDPEAHGERPAVKPSHSRTKPYEETTAEGDHKASADLLEVKAFLTENKIPDAFLLTLLKEKKLIDDKIKTVPSIQPGILRRVLGEKSKANLIKAWAAQQADEDSGSANAPDPDWPEAKRPKKINGEVRTNEGDQTQGRKPVMDDITPEDYLMQEVGHKNWRKVKVHWGNDKGKTLGSLPAKSLVGYWINKWQPKPYKGVWQDKDILLDMALCLASAEMNNE